MGRPKKEIELPNAAVIQLLQLHNGNLYAVAKVIGLNRMTLYKRIKENPVLSDALEEVRESFKDRAEHLMYEKILAGDTASLHRFLIAQARERGWADKREVELSGGGSYTIVWGVGDEDAAAPK